MAELQGEARAAYVRRMFSRIARRYDRLNRWMTAGQDLRWRREVIQRADLQPGEGLLDLGCGTGDLALEALRQAPRARVVGADFTHAMLAVAQRRPKLQARPAWILADALHLPFPDGAFDAVVSGFLLRNLGDLPAALAEMRRVLVPGRGRLLCLETTPLSPNWLRPLLAFHMKRVIPFLGRWLAGDAAAYNYLPASTESFPTAPVLADALQREGFVGVGFVKRMFGTIAIHWGRRPPPTSRPILPGAS
jgi:demethylmenaquinone methyltransferase/2-methoxy-6-polyprenyl-1,4-benzoquinol methylase